MTKEDLIKVKEEYELNFQKLVESVGTPEHAFYVAEEHRLNKKEIRVMKKLKVYIESPCPMHGGKDCVDCRGYYRRVQRGRTKRFHDPIFRMIAVTRDFANAIWCPIKQELREAKDRNFKRQDEAEALWQSLMTLNE